MTKYNISISINISVSIIISTIVNISVSIKYEQWFKLWFALVVPQGNDLLPSCESTRAGSRQREHTMHGELISGPCLFVSFRRYCFHPRA